MQAVRLARYHTRRSHLVRFCGAYHGWWGDVQPGVGNPIAGARHLHAGGNVRAHAARAAPAAGHRLRPGQPAAGAASECAGAPADSSLVDSSRHAGFDRDAYTTGCGSCAQVCDERKIVLIFDEVFVGFRLARGGAKEYFGVQPDLITYGKTLGGGLPVGVLCGRRELMKRYRADHPVDVCFARGTFNSHPYVMGAMTEFLHRLRFAGNQRAVPRSRPALERSHRATQSAGCDAGRLAGQDRQPLVDLDRQLYPAVALQLDAAILSPRRRARAELGRHRAADLQPELSPMPISPRSRTVSWPPVRPCSGTAGGGRTETTTNRSIKRRILWETLNGHRPVASSRTPNQRFRSVMLVDGVLCHRSRSVESNHAVASQLMRAPGSTA